MNICANCKHSRGIVENTYAICKAHPLPILTDPIDGRQYCIANRCRSYDIKTAYKSCYTVNHDGNCPDFKPKPIKPTFIQWFFGMTPMSFCPRCGEDLRKNPKATHDCNANITTGLGPR